MDVQLINDTAHTSDGTTYRHVQMAVDKQMANVMIVSGKHNYVNVVVKNASHRAFRGPGRDFASAQQALDTYKSEKIKAMIRFACGL